MDKILRLSAKILPPKLLEVQLFSGTQELEKKITFGQRETVTVLPVQITITVSSQLQSMV